MSAPSTGKLDEDFARIFGGTPVKPLCKSCGSPDVFPGVAICGRCSDGTYVDLQMTRFREGR